jgi:WD40 repeat protein
VKIVAWLEERRILATGSWDKTLKYWDGRSANPVLSGKIKLFVFFFDTHDQV